jgi:hypothetical protein
MVKVLVSAASSSGGNGSGKPVLAPRPVHPSRPGVRQQDLGGSAAAAARPPGPHVDRLGPQAADVSAPAVSPALEGVATSAARAAHRPVGQVLLGRLAGADDDRRAVRAT